MPGVDRATRRMLDQVGSTVRNARAQRRWTQRQLGRASGCSHAVIGRIERGSMPDLSFRTTLRVLRALSIEPELRLVAPRIEAPPLRDRAHARCVGAVGRRLARAGYEVSTEVEVGSGRWRGFIDVIAFHRLQRLLLVFEIKTELRDLGDVDRQLRGYVDAAWPAAAGFGWKPRGVTGVLLFLATSETDSRIQDQRTYIDQAFQLRARSLARLTLGAPEDLPTRGSRGLGMIDPASRRRSWILPTVIDGRRTPAPYLDRLGFLSGGRLRQRRNPG